jgi:hypothetical protein
LVNFQTNEGFPSVQVDSGNNRIRVVAKRQVPSLEKTTFLGSVFSQLFFIVPHEYLRPSFVMNLNDHD